MSRKATTSKKLINQKDKNKKSSRKLSLSKTSTAERIRTTVELSKIAFSVVQDIQHQYRLRTGKVLPLWKVISDAIIIYGQEKGVS
jgi:lysyl-tRNA synthetase class II